MDVSAFVAALAVVMSPWLLQNMQTSRARSFLKESRVLDGEARDAMESRALGTVSGSRHGLIAVVEEAHRMRRNALARRALVELRTLTGHTDEVYSADVFPDGKHIGTGSGDKTAKVWDVESGTEMCTLEGHTEGVFAAVFPDGQRIVTASADKTAKVWHVELGTEMCTLEGHTGGVFSASPVRNGTAVITAGADKKIILHDRLG